MAIPLEKILSMHHQDYVPQGTHVREIYALHQVHHVARIYSHDPGNFMTEFKRFAATVPDEAEAVVDFRYEVEGGTDNYRLVHYEGLALIPKTRDYPAEKTPDVIKEGSGE